jgi:hypothetical protein
LDTVTVAWGFATTVNVALATFDSAAPPADVALAATEIVT